MTGAAPASVSRPGHRVRLAGLCALAVVFIAALGGNVFSVHVGMASTADQADVTSFNDGEPSAGLVAALEQDRPPMRQGDLRQLMHLMGACLGLVAVDLLLLVIARQARRRLGDPAALQRMLPTRDIGRPSDSPWRAPLSPPTASPVIRT